MKRAFLFVAVVAVCLAQTAAPPAPISIEAFSAYFLKSGQALTDPLIASQYKWAHINAPLTGALDATNTLQLGVTLPSPPSQPRICSFSFPADGLAHLTPGANTYQWMGCPNNTSQTWTVTAIHCWSDNIGLSTADVVNNAGTSFMLMPVSCSPTQAGGGTAGVLANAPPNLPPNALSDNTTLAPGDAFNFKLVTDGVTLDFRVTLDYQ